MTMEEVRNELLKEKTAEKRDSSYLKGYIDGVLDMYNKSKELVSSKIELTETEGDAHVIDCNPTS